MFINQTAIAILVISGPMLLVNSNANASTVYKCQSNGITTYSDSSSGSSCKSLTAQPKQNKYVCWANQGKGRKYYSDTNGGQACMLNTSSQGVAVSAAPATSSLPTDSIFSSTSFWYKPIPSNAPLHENSTNFVTEFVNQKTQYYNNVTINTYNYSSPVFNVDATTPKADVAFNDCQHKGYLDSNFASMMKQVSIPAYALPSNGSDKEVSFYDKDSKTLWELWHANKDTTTGKWTACWGGKMSNTNLDQGIFQKGYGTTATGLPFLGGQITAEELQRGEIKHVIGISLVNTEKFSIISWPANRSDGYNPNNLPNRIAEGQRFRLDPAINVDSLPMSKAGKTIAKAAQKYGFVVWDKAGSISIRAQNAMSYTATGIADPYPVLYEKKPSYAVLNGFPWEKLQFLPMNYGKP